MRRKPLVPPPEGPEHEGGSSTQPTKSEQKPPHPPLTRPIALCPSKRRKVSSKLLSVASCGYWSLYNRQAHWKGCLWIFFLIPWLCIAALAQVLSKPITPHKLQQLFKQYGVQVNDNTARVFFKDQSHSFKQNYWKIVQNHDPSYISEPTDLQQQQPNDRPATPDPPSSVRSGGSKRGPTRAGSLQSMLAKAQEVTEDALKLETRLDPNTVAGPDLGLPPPSPPLPRSPVHPLRSTPTSSSASAPSLPPSSPKPDSPPQRAPQVPSPFRPYVKCFTSLDLLAAKELDDAVLEIPFGTIIRESPDPVQATVHQALQVFHLLPPPPPPPPRGRDAKGQRQHL